MFLAPSVVNFYNSLVQISSIDLLLILQKLNLLKNFKQCCGATSFRSTSPDENVNGKYQTIANLVN